MKVAQSRSRENANRAASCELDFILPGDFIGLAGALPSG